MITTTFKIVHTHTYTHILVRWQSLYGRQSTAR